MTNILLTNVIDNETLLINILFFKTIDHKALLIHWYRINKNFALKLYKNSNANIFKIQIHFFFHNIIYFKYNITINKKR